MLAMNDLGGNTINLEFHHVSWACDNIQVEEEKLKVLGYTREGTVFEDQVQGIRGSFLTGQSPRIELLEQLPGSTVLRPWLQAGIKIYHFAYRTRDIQRSIDELSAAGAKLIVNPVSAVAFSNRKIAFLMLPNRFMIELISES